MRVLIGYITYNDLTARYLPSFLASLSGQSYTDRRIIVFDNSEREDNENRRYLHAGQPGIEIIRTGENLGFARANNILIRRAIEAGAEYVWLLNPDTLSSPDTLEKLVAAMDAEPKLGSVSAKINRWDFANGIKTEIIDSCGIVLRGGLRFHDLGQGQEDRGRYDQASILGPSGTAPLYRVKALKGTAETRGGREEFFDERMFMYKEDCDLALRLRQAGWRSRLVPEAIVYHDRSVAGTGESDLAVAMNRRNKGRQAKRWSFVNQHSIFLKHWESQTFLGKIAILWYAFQMLIFVLLFERFLLIEYSNIIRQWKR
jgi:GT2 family glycosyltransferase